MTVPGELSGEDAKLVVLARAARSRAYVRTAPAEGAAVRDSDGRTYSAATVEVTLPPGLTTTALRGAVVAAVSSGARSFEAAVVVGDVVVGDVASVAEEDLALLREFGAGVPVLLVGADGVVVRHATS